MTNLHNLTVAMRKAMAIKERIEELQSELDSLTGEAGIAAPKPARRGRPPGKRHMSIAARARIGLPRGRAGRLRRGQKAAAKAAAPVEKKNGG